MVIYHTRPFRVLFIEIRRQFYLLCFRDFVVIIRNHSKYRRGCYSTNSPQWKFCWKFLPNIHIYMPTVNWDGQWVARGCLWSCLSKREVREQTGARHQIWHLSSKDTSLCIPIQETYPLSCTPRFSSSTSHSSWDTVYGFWRSSEFRHRDTPNTFRDTIELLGSAANFTRISQKWCCPTWQQASNGRGGEFFWGGNGDWFPLRTPIPALNRYGVN